MLVAGFARTFQRAPGYFREIRAYFLVERRGPLLVRHPERSAPDRCFTRDLVQNAVTMQVLRAADWMSQGRTHISTMSAQAGVQLIVNNRSPAHSCSEKNTAHIRAAGRHAHAMFTVKRQLNIVPEYRRQPD